MQVDYASAKYGSVNQTDGACVCVCAAARYEETVMPLDEFLPALYTTHPRADVTLQLADRVRPELSRTPAQPLPFGTVDDMYKATPAPVPSTESRITAKSESA